MKGSSTVLLVVFGIYFAIIGVGIFLAIRWSKRHLAARNEALRGALQSSGASPTQKGQQGGYFDENYQEYEVNGLRVVAGTRYVSRSYYRVSLRIEGAAMPFVVIYPEKAVDRFGKVLGLNREVQTGDSSFDDVAYIDSVESDETVKRLLESPALRQAISRALELGYKVEFSSQGVEVFQVVMVGNLPDVSGVNELVSLLGQMASKLPRFDPDSFKGKLPYNPWVIFAMLSWLPLLILGFAADAALGGPVDRMISQQPGRGLLVLASGFAAWLLYTTAVGLSLKGRSYAFRTLLFAAFMGVFSTPICGLVGMAAVNELTDKSEATRHNAKVLRRHSYKSERWLSVTPVEAGKPDLKLSVGGSVYNKAQPGMAIAVRLHAGALGLLWHERVAADDLSPAPAAPSTPAAPSASAP